MPSTASATSVVSFSPPYGKAQAPRTPTEKPDPSSSDEVCVAIFAGGGGGGVAVSAGLVSVFGLSEGHCANAGAAASMVAIRSSFFTLSPREKLSLRLSFSLDCLRSRDLDGRADGCARGRLDGRGRPAARREEAERLTGVVLRLDDRER